jgi:CRISPR-associated protein Cas2
VTMTLVITRNVPDRFRGFLASVMAEVTLGVYCGPAMTVAVRDRVWTVMTEWFEAIGEADAAVVMTWPDARAPGGQAFRTLGVPRVELQAHDGMLLVRSELTQETRRSLTTHEERNRGAASDEAAPDAASRG